MFVINMTDLDKSQMKCYVTSLLRWGQILIFMRKKIAFPILLPILGVAARGIVSLKHKMNSVILFDWLTSANLFIPTE